MKIVLATQNQGKMREITALAPEKAWHFVPLSDYTEEAVAETGLTFVENALIKARHAAKISGLPALSDDSGLVIPALAGHPGIYSSRYAGKEGDAKGNIAKVLMELKDIPTEKRDATFYCVLTFLLYPDDPVPLICQGEWSGSILFEPEGNEGFGYDPIFYVKALKKSAAKLSLADKNKFSHRAQALQRFLQLLPDKLCTLSLLAN